MSDDPKPTLIFYGNCQANALSWLFGADPSIAGAFDVHYLASFDDRIPGTSEIRPEIVAAAAVLFEQFGPVEFPHRALLPASCVTITFPSIDLNLLWPLHAKNHLNDPATPEHLWGRFPYGDRIIIRAVERGLTVDEVLALYDQEAREELPDLDRVARLEWRRLAARDAKCDVKMADYVAATFRSENLFWCINHPSMTALREISHRLLAVAAERGVAISAGTLEETIAGLPPQGPLGFYRVPVHPSIVDHFNIGWLPGPAQREYGLREEPLTYEEYLRAMIECAVEVHAALEPAKAQ